MGFVSFPLCQLKKKVLYLQQVCPVNLKSCNAVKWWARYKRAATSQQEFSLEKSSCGLIQGFLLRLQALNLWNILKIQRAQN